MSYALEVNLPNLPKGAKVEVAGLGVYKNGETTPVPDDLLTLWKMNNPIEDDEGRRNPGDLSKANFQEGITVKRVKAQKPEENKPEGGN